MAHCATMPDRQDHAPAAFCQRCGVAMKLVGSIPKLGPHPELYRFECTDCGEVETKEGRGEPVLLW